MTTTTRPAPTAIEHLDYKLTCRVIPPGEHFLCGLKADWMLILRCCGHQTLVCNYCLVEMQPHPGHDCRTCGAGGSFAELVREVLPI